MTKTTKSKSKNTKRVDFNESTIVNEKNEPIDLSEFLPKKKATESSTIKLRDEKGRFTTWNKKFTRWTRVLWKWVLILGGVAFLVNSYADWYLSHEIVRQDAFNLKIQAPYRIEDRKPREVISPLAKDIVEAPVEVENMTDTEKMLLEAFGERNYAVARGVAKCESNFNEEAINWESKDLGIMQINWPVWGDEIKEKFGYSISDLLSADKNIEVAKWIWDRGDGQEGDGKGSFSPWVALRSECMRGEL